MSKTSSYYARRYIEAFGFHIVPIEPGRKFPRSKNWGNSTLTNPESASIFYSEKPDWNMGIALGPSKKCSLDIDCMDSFKIICDAFGVDLDQLIKDTPTIKGRGLRLMFSVPDGVDLPLRQIRWHRESDPKGELYRSLQKQATEAKNDGNTELEAKLREEAKQYNQYTVFELRAATDGKQRQDVLPPSIHPETGEPYKWVSQPRKENWPTVPDWLLTLWTEFDKVKNQFMAACPWLPIEEIYKPEKRNNQPPRFNGDGGFARVVEQYNAHISIEQALLNYGYERKGRRFLSPHSGTGLPGVHPFNDSNRCWIHHGSDPLCSDDSGRPVAPFDLFCYYEHNGDFTRAVRAAANQLGISLSTPNTPARPQRQQPTIDQETGEVLYDAPASDAPVDVLGGEELPAELQPQSVDYFSPLLWVNPKNDRPLAHHENLREILRRLNVTARYNVIKKSQELLIPGAAYTTDNRENASLAWLESQCSVFNFPTTNVKSFLTLLCEENIYNPVATWITSTEWDGIDRLTEFLNTVTTSGNVELKNTLIKRWMLSAIDAAFNPDGVSARGVLVFQGEQAMGKTQWFKNLVDDHELPDVTQDGVILRPEDKDSVKLAVSHWLVELGELDATFKRSDIAQLKGFITKQNDILRLPYAPRESNYARRTVFFGSVNPREFLNDPTGNSRFWTIACTHIDHKHGMDMQQVWAQVYDLYKQGERHHLKPEEAALLESGNEEYMAIDPIEERLLKMLDWESPQSTWSWNQATAVLMDCGLDKPTRAESTKAASFIRKMNGGQGKYEKRRRVLLVPPKLPIHHY